MGDIRIIGIFGNLGSGKSALMTLFGREFNRMYGIPVRANYEFRVPYAKRYNPSELVGDEVIDTCFCVDEIYTIADARMSMSEQNIFFSYFIAQARKSPHVDGSRGVGNYVVYTAQLERMAEIRLFELTNLYIFIERRGDGNFYWESVTDEGNESDGVFGFDLFWREAVPFYNTDEKIMPLGIDSLKYSMERFEPERRNVRVDNVVALLMREFEWKSFKEIQRFTIEDFIYRRGFPEKLAKPVFDRCRELVRLKSLKK